MKGVIERRANQVVHRRVDDDKIPGVALLHIDHLGDQDAGIADDQAARLEDDLETKRGHMLANDRRISVRQWRRLVVGTVGNAQPAAEVDVLDGVAVGTQLADQVDEQREGVVERLQFGDLAADMGVDAGDADAGQRRGPGVDMAGALPGYAEFVLGLAGRDLAMGPGIDVRVDAHRDGGDDTGCDGTSRKQLQLGLGFDVEAVNAGGKREIHLARRLADA